MASKSLGTLTLDLIAKIGGFTGPLDKAERKTKDSTKKMAGYAKNVGIAFAAAGVAAAAGLGALARQSINTADEMSKTAKIVAINIEDLSALRHAADLSGVSFGELSSGLNRFNRSNADAFEGIGAGADAYEALGITVKNTDGVLKSNYELIEEVADAFASMEDGAVKSSVAQDLFGRSGAKLIPLLNGGRAGMAGFADEAERLGLVFSQETGSAAEQFNDNLRRLQLTMVGLGNRIAAEALPALVEFTDVLADPEFQAGVANIATGIVNIGTAAVEAIKFLQTFGTVLGEEIAKAVNGINMFDLASVDAEISKIEGLLENRLSTIIKNPLMRTEQAFANREELMEELEKLIAQRDLIISSSPPPNFLSVIPPKPEAGAPSGSSSNEELEFLAEVGRAAAEAGKSVDALNLKVEEQAAIYREQLALTSDSTELEKIRYAISSGALVGINAEHQKLLEGLATEVTRKIELAEIERDRAEQDEQIASQYQSAKSVLLDQEERLREAAEDRYQAIRAAFEAGLIGEEEYGKLVEKNTKLVEEQVDALENKMDTFAENAARSIQGEISDALGSAFDGSSKDILDNWGDLLNKMVRDAIAADITRALFGQESGEGFGTGQLVSGLGSLFAGFFDSGGHIPAGKVGIAGEKGLEFISGPATVTGRLDTERLLNGGGQTMVTNNLTLQGRIDRRTESQIAREFAQKTRIATARG